MPPINTSPPSTGPSACAPCASCAPCAHPTAARPSPGAALALLGYQALPRGHTRRFKHFGTWEKDGLRLALSSDWLQAERGCVMKYAGDGDTFTLEALICDPPLRGLGRARQAMEALTALADTRGWLLYLEPVPLEPGSGLGRPALIRFYASLGFCATDAASLVMCRAPSTGQA